MLVRERTNAIWNVETRFSRSTDPISMMEYEFVSSRRID